MSKISVRDNENNRWQRNAKTNKETKKQKNKQTKTEKNKGGQKQ